MHFEEKISGKQVFSGKIITINHDSVRLENGKTSLREVVHHPGAVAIFLVQDGNVILVKQYRYAIQRELFEIPAGKIDENEPPINAAKRELLEETGIRDADIYPLGEYFGSPGVFNEIIHIFFAKGGVSGAQNPDEDEFLSVIPTPMADFESMIASGRITDGKTVFAYALAKMKGLI